MTGPLLYCQKAQMLDKLSAIFYKEQYGFREYNDTEIATTDLITEIQTNLDILCFFI